MVGADLEVLLCDGLGDSPARVARASSAGISLKREFRHLRHSSDSLILHRRTLRPEKVSKVIPVI